MLAQISQMMQAEGAQSPRAKNYTCNNPRVEPLKEETKPLHFSFQWDLSTKVIEKTLIDQHP